MTLEILEYLKRVQAMAKVGLSYTENPFDLERYEELRDRTNDLIARLNGVSVDAVNEFFDTFDAYPTPKVDVRALVFREGKVLLIREKLDGLWALPGGWAEVGFSPAENIRKEVREESGFQVEVVRLLSVWDKRMHDHPPSPEYTYKLNFLCEITGGALNPGFETLGGDFFDPGGLPPLSLPRNTPDQLRRLIELTQNHQPTSFD